MNSHSRSTVPSIDWLGQLGRRWQTTTLGRVGRFHMGTTFPHAFQGNESGKIPFIKVSDFSLADKSGVISTANNWVSLDVASRLGARVLPQGCILYPRAGAALLLNQRRITGRPCIVDDNVRGFEPHSGDVRFWRYLMTLLDMKRITNPGPVPSVSETQVSSVQVPLPPLGEQRRIADFLDIETTPLDRLTTLRKEQLTLLRSRRFSLVREVLMQGLRSTVTESTGLSWLPQCPADWKLTPLRYVTQCLDGKRVPLSAEERASRQGPYPYYGASRVVDHIDDYLFDEQLVLLGEDGAQLGNPELEVSFFIDGKIWVNNHAHVLRPTGINGQLLAEILNVFDRQLCMSGATREKITQEEMNHILLPVPPIDQQSELVEWISSERFKLSSLQDALHRQIATIAERRQALITAAVTGQFDVSTASGRNVTDGV
ncbi:restriction endonuclease subunit S [Streptomyces sp. NPDC021019]|uniref:restriction endonuclease subunit S n=1 Tax=Streptomyces sp. NPDC021019 TaxID=3365108 RepID=UPI003788338B